MSFAGTACTEVVNLYNQTSVTGDTLGSFIKVPNGILNYYLKVTATEQVAGSATVSIFFNEAASITNGALLHAFSLTITAALRAKDVDSSGTFDYLGPYLYVVTSSVTGTWDISVDLVHSYGV